MLSDITVLLVLVSPDLSATRLELLSGPPQLDKGLTFPLTFSVISETKLVFELEVPFKLTKLS